MDPFQAANWAKGRIGITRHSKAQRRIVVYEPDHRPDPDYPDFCWCGRPLDGHEK